MTTLLDLHPLDQIPKQNWYFFLKTSFICLNRSSWPFGGHNKRVSVSFFLMLCGFTSNTSTRPRMHTRIKVLVCFTLKEDHDASKRTSTCTQISIFHSWACSVSLVFMLVLIIHSKMLDYTRITVNNIKCLYLPDRFIILDPIDRDWCWV